jgi:hypothetical protein
LGESSNLPKPAHAPWEKQLKGLIFWVGAPGKRPLLGLLRLVSLNSAITVPQATNKMWPERILIVAERNDGGETDEPDQHL